MELDLWLGGDEGQDPLMSVKETVAGVSFELAGERITLYREDVRTLFLSLKYWHDLGKDN